jgi:hypothetical protein
MVVYLDIFQKSSLFVQVVYEIANVYPIISLVNT